MAKHSEVSLSRLQFYGFIDPLRFRMLPAPQAHVAMPGDVLVAMAAESECAAAAAVCCVCVEEGLQVYRIQAPPTRNDGACTRQIGVLFLQSPCAV